MSTGEEVLTAVEAAPTADARPNFLHRIAPAVLTLGAGAVIGCGAGYCEPAPIDIAGTHAEAYAKLFQPYTTFGVGVNLKVPQSNPYVGGELDVKSVPAFEVNGKLDTALFEEYLQLFSDKEQIASNVEWAVEKHLLEWTMGGLAIGGLMYGAGRHVRKKWQAHFTEAQQAEQLAFMKPYRRGLNILLACGVAYATLPGGDTPLPDYRPLHADPLFADVSSLRGSQLSGPLAPLINLSGSYVKTLIETYITNDNKAYDEQLHSLADYLKANPVPIPSGDDIVNFGYVTDRHCNIGMDRIVVGLMNAYGIKLVVSGGDDDFSGSFSFEAGCTSDIAERAKKAHMQLVFTLGNHDSSMTASNEKKQGITVLNKDIVTVDGIHFTGSPDPRASRWGTGLEIDGKIASDKAQAEATAAQGRVIGQIACKGNKKIIAVLHDPNAGKTALENGCGKTTFTLDGHTHRQAGPTDIPLINGTDGIQFTGASSGGAPAEGEVMNANPLEHVTVGPLEHPATVNIVTYNIRTGLPVGVTVFTFDPDHTVSSKYLPVDYNPASNAQTGTLISLFPNSKAVLAKAAA